MMSLSDFYFFLLTLRRMIMRTRGNLPVQKVRNRVDRWRHSRASLWNSNVLTMPTRRKPHALLASFALCLCSFQAKKNPTTKLSH